MLKFIDKHPFISGFITGFIGVGIVGKRLRRYVEGKITIIQLELTDGASNFTFKDNTSTETDPQVKEEN
jgi:hypothetical protein